MHGRTESMKKEGQLFLKRKKKETNKHTRTRTQRAWKNEIGSHKMDRSFDDKIMDTIRVDEETATTNNKCRWKKVRSGRDPQYRVHFRTHARTDGWAPFDYQRKEKILARLYVKPHVMVWYGSIHNNNNNVVK
mgnify:CR=1 FL=1